MSKFNKKAFVSQRDIQAAVRAMHRHNTTAMSEAAAGVGDPNAAYQFALAITGACGHLVGKLTDEPGASKTLITEVFPYSQAISDQMVGNPHHPELASVSEEMAVKLAIHAMTTSNEALRLYTLGRSHTPGPARKPRIIGLGVTAAVQTERTRKGSDRAYLALAYPNGRSVLIEVHFAREGWEGKTAEGKRSLRKAQSLVLEVLALNLILHAMGLEQIPMRFASLPGKVLCPDLRFAPDGDTFTLQPRSSSPFVPVASEADLRLRPAFIADGRDQEIGWMKDPFYIAGSLNPVTPAHRYMASVAHALRRSPIFLLNRTHPDKGNGNLSLAEVNARLKSCWRRVDVLVTEGMDFYAEKAEQLPRGTFAIGYDVFLKLVNPENPRRLSDLARIQATGSTFVVFARNGKRLDKSLIPDGYADLFTDVKELFKDHPDPAWRNSPVVGPNLSSTEFRAAYEAAQPPKRP